jgi:SRSO17 transposase
MGLPRSNDSESRFSAYVQGLTSLIGHADCAKPLRDYCLGSMILVSAKALNRWRRFRRLNGRRRAMYDLSHHLQWHHAICCSKTDNYRPSSIKRDFIAHLQAHDRLYG